MTVFLPLTNSNSWSGFLSEKLMVTCIACTSIFSFTEMFSYDNVISMILINTSLNFTLLSDTDIFVEDIAY